MSLSNTYAVAGKSVLVTGAGSGIGRAIARAFLDQGARVAVLGRRREPLEETVEGRDAAFVVSADLSDAEAVRAAVDEVVGRFGGLDVVVSNAAGYAGGGIEELSADDWATMRGANVDGMFHLAQAALPRLVESGGNLVAVSSVSGMRGDWNQAGYNATKHAVNGFIRSLALDYGARGVRLNAVAPALTVTDMTEAVHTDDEARGAFENRVALGRIGEPTDIAPAVLWLASDDAAYVTGVILPVDGGTSASTGQPHL